MSSYSSRPRHVAIIPDGNRRWAKAQGKTSAQGHIEGAKRFKPVALAAAEKGVQHLSMWGLSLTNLTSRSSLEVVGLLQLFQAQFETLQNDADIHQKQIRIQVFGRWRQKFPVKLVQAIEAAQEATASYANHYLNFFLAYNGTDEMVAAVQAIADEAARQPLEVSGEVIKQHLFTKDLPPVDLVIRTGGEPHLSAGFMMWDIAESELYFSEKLWPDFTPQDFDEALAWYAARDRRLGK